MKCKNCGKETKILVDDGIGSHVEEFDTCMACRGWVVSDSTSLINVSPDGYLEGGGWPSKRLRRIDSGEDTPEEYVKHSRDFEAHMKACIGSMSYNEWLEEYDREAKKRGF